MAKGDSGLAAPVWKARRSSLNSGAPWPTPDEAAEWVLGIQRKLHRWACDDQSRRFSDLHNLVCDRATLLVAWGRVRGNRGSRSAGVDGQTAAHVERVLGVERFLEELREQLRAGSFRPVPVKERRIPKRGDKTRRLGIPTLRDRVVQAALKLVLEPIFEADFQPCAYGFRPRRRAQDAIAEIHQLTSRSYEWIVEADIEACFDSLDHTALTGRVRARVGDRRVLRLVKAFLKAGIMNERGDFEETRTGTPQGGILSPLLANIALSALDVHFARAWQAMGGGTQRHRRRLRGEATYRLVRYADDFVICVAGERRHAQALVAEVERVLTPLGLALSREKTAVTHIDEGFRLPRLADQARPGTSRPARGAHLRVQALAPERDDEGEADHHDRPSADARPAPRPAQPGAAGLVRLLPARRLLEDLQLPRRLHLAAGHLLAAKETPAGELALAATPPPPRLAADRHPARLRVFP